MKYIKNGTLINDSHKGQIAYSLDGTTWKYYSKEKIKDVSGYGTIVKLSFEGGTNTVIDLKTILNQSTWTTGNLAGLTNALNDIASWLGELIPSTVNLDNLQNSSNALDTDLLATKAIINNLLAGLGDVKTKQDTAQTSLTALQNAISDIKSIETNAYTLFNDIKSILDSSQNKLISIQNYLSDLKKYQNGSNGFDIITSMMGTVNGHWYLIRPLEPVGFNTLTDNGNNIAQTWGGITFTAETPLNTGDLDGNGFTSVQLAMGRVIAYKK